ncbi:hypothetical protein ACF1G5_42485 [Streptomyces coeruleorubidus]|uniref:hypothetical protein n=1 Tax=Streptomyces coeruleorubidus TaxID=116188 RepID=UPI0036F62E4D
MRRTSLALLTVVCLALAGCSSGGEPEEEKSVTVTATATPTATPSLSQAETKRRCSLAVAEAAPEWKDWSYSPGDWQNDPRTPEVCLGLADEVNPPAGNRAYGDAFRDGLEMADDPRADQ